jgi:CheY-like chemotaxis protein
VRIVLVEDDRLQQAEYSHVVLDIVDGCDLRLVSTESEFRQFLDDARSEAAPALFIIDAMLRWADPGSDMPPMPGEVLDGGFHQAGTRCVRAIRALPELAHVPVVLLSALEREDALGSLYDRTNVFYCRKGGGHDSLAVLLRSIFAATEEVSGPGPGEVWLDSAAKPVLVLGFPKPDPLIGIQMCDMGWLERGPARDRWAVPVERSSANGLDEDMHVDCASLMACEPKALEVLLGRVDSGVLKRIDAQLKEMSSVATSNERKNRFAARDVQKHDYDVALSFAGADRRWASALADSLLSRGLRVFYDEYEKANLWGKDLVQHLDEVYRLRARCCIVLASSDYASSIWTNHELKSALARSLIDNEEYLLPVRLDDTALPGLRPTVGYVSLASVADVERIADLVSEKLGQRNLISYAEFSSKWIQNVLEINSRWGLDCLAFCVDQRFLLDEDGFECRVGISYGINRTSPRVGFLQPTEQEGENVFGLHAVAVLDGTKLCLWDQWLDSLPAPTTDRLEDAVADAYRALAGIGDAQYVSLASSASTRDELLVSSRYLLDEFDISTELG